MKKTAALLFFLSAGGLFAAEASVPMDPEGFKNLRTKLRAVQTKNQILTDSCEQFVKDLTVLSRRTDVSLQEQIVAADKVFNLLRVQEILKPMRQSPLLESTVIPFETRPFPDKVEAPTRVPFTAELSTELHAAAAQDAAALFSFELLPLKDGEITLTAGSFKAPDGTALACGDVSVKTLLPSKELGIPAKYRIILPVKADAKPGLYRAPLTVKQGDKTLELTLHLRVYPFTLPAPQAFDGGDFLTLVPAGEKNGFNIWSSRTGKESAPALSLAAYPDDAELESAVKAQGTALKQTLNAGELFFRHPRQQQLSSEFLKAGINVATFGATEDFIDIPLTGKNLIHFQKSPSRVEVMRWHKSGVRVFSCISSTADWTPGKCRRNAGLIPYGNSCNGVLLEKTFADSELLETAMEDVRYITLLRDLLKKAYDTKNQLAIYAGKKAVAWFMLQDLERFDLDLMRYEMADHIAYMQSVLAQEVKE